MILVTGGSGFVGSHLIQSLLEDREKVVNIDIKCPSHDRREFLRWDIVNPDPPVSSIEETYHLAAIPWTRVKNESDWFAETQQAIRVNALGTYNILQLESEAFIFSSTANVYGNGRQFKEDSPKRISSPYGYSKAIAEGMIELSGEKYTIFRFGTVIGPRGRCFPNRLV